MGFGLGKDSFLVNLVVFKNCLRFDSSLVSMPWKNDVMALNNDLAALHNLDKCKGSSIFNLIVSVGKRKQSDTDPEKIIKISMISFMV